MSEKVLAERAQRYGAFSVNSAVSQEIKKVLRGSPNWDSMDSDMKEALEMIAHKISRIVVGDPYYDDSWVDIAGYATRVAERLEKM